MPSLLTGLIAYFKLDGNTNNSVGAPNATSSNLTYTAGKINNCGVFNDSTSNIITGSIAYGTSYSVSLWAYINNITGNDTLYSTDTSQTASNITIRNNNGNCLIDVLSSSNANNTFTVGGVFTAGTFKHIVMTFLNNTHIKIYVDNVLISTLSMSLYGFSAKTCSSLLGMYNTGGTFPLGGRLDEVAIYNNRELTQSEVTALYNQGLGLSHPFPSIINNTQNIVATSFKSNHNFSVTLNATCKKLVVSVGTGNGQDVIGITYNGTPLILARKSSASAFYYANIYYLDNPPTGSALNLSLTLSGNGSLNGTVFDLNNTQSDFGASNLASSTTPIISTSVTSTKTKSPLINAFCGSQFSSESVAFSETLTVSGNTFGRGTDAAVAYKFLPSIGSYTTGYNTANNQNTLCAVEFLEGSSSNSNFFSFM